MRTLEWGWVDRLIGRPGIAMIVAVMLAACSPGQSTVANNADDRAYRAGLVMLREKDGDAVDMVRRVVGGDPAADTAIEALIAEGDRFGGRIVLRITERDASPAQFSVEEGSTVRCYEYVLEDLFDDINGRHIDCPDLAAMTIPDAAPLPTLPGGIADQLLEALELLAASDADESAIRQHLSSLAGGVEVFELTTVADTGIGVVFGNGDDECVSGRITVDGTVEVWRVPPVIAQPGELGCSASSAASGLGKDPPH